MCRAAGAGADPLPAPVLHMCHVCENTDYRYPWTKTRCILCGSRVNPVIFNDWSGPMFLFRGGERISARLYTASSGCPSECMHNCTRVGGYLCRRDH